MQFSPEQEAELKALRQAEPGTPSSRRSEDKTGKLMQQVRDLGRSPKETAGRCLAERQLAEKLRRARKAKLFSPEQEAELLSLRRSSACDALETATTAIVSLMYKLQVRSPDLIDEFFTPCSILAALRPQSLRRSLHHLLDSGSDATPISGTKSAQPARFWPRS